MSLKALKSYALIGWVSLLSLVCCDSDVAAQEQLYLYRSDDGQLKVSPTPVGETSQRIQARPLTRTRLAQHHAAKARARRAPKYEPYLELVEQASARHNIPVALILAVIEVESHFNPRATSRVGAMGLMQLMPSVAKGYSVTDAYDAAQNIEAGTHLLATLKTRYQGDLNKILAAYNAGGVRVRKKGGIPSLATRGYVSKVMRAWTRYAQLLGHKGPSEYIPKHDLQDLLKTKESPR